MTSGAHGPDGTDGPDGARLPAEPDHIALRDRMAPELPAGLVAHIARVVVLTERLARHHGASPGPALRAAQGHDLLRALPDGELLARAEAGGLRILPVERAQPVLLHGPLGALELAERFGLRDPVVLDAVRYHTTGHPAFGPEGWAVFVADKVEPNKLAHWPALQGVLDLATESLEAAALAYLELSAARAIREGWTVHPLAAETRAALAAAGSRPV